MFDYLISLVHFIIVPLDEKTNTIKTQKDKWRLISLLDIQ